MKKKIIFLSEHAKSISKIVMRLAGKEIEEFLVEKALFFFLSSVLFGKSWKSLEIQDGSS